MTTKVPTIPPLTGDNVDYILTNIKMLLDVREGRAGDKLDSNITYRDLVNLGLAKDAKGNVIYTGGAAALKGLPVVPFGVDNDGYDPTKDLTPPPAPTDVTAVGSIGVVYLTWNQPTYRNHSYAEVWRSESDDVGSAVLVGQASAQGYVDVPGDSITRYYWIRFVSKASVKGPYSQESTSAKADIDPAVLISKVEGEFASSKLAQTLADKITLLEGDARNAVTTVKNSVVTLDSAVTQQFTTVNATLGDLSTSVQTEAAARASADGSLFAQYTVKIDANGHVSGFGLASETVDGTTESAFIIRADKFAVVDPASTANNLTDTPSADTVPFAVVGGNVYLKSAVIQDASISSAKIASLVANKITSGYINAVVGINGAKVYGAELYSGGSTTAVTDAGGNVTGFTVANPTVKISGGNATFVASSFKVSNSATGTPTDFVPFQVVNNTVYISSAMIANASISLAKIDTANITSLSSIKANMGTITAGKMQSGDSKFVIDLDNKTISIET